MSIRILVVVHNASPGTPTMELASHWASRLGGSVVGLGVVDESTALPAPMVAGGAAGMGGIVMSDNEALRAKADKAVAEALRELGKQCEEKGVSYRDSQQSGVPQECVLLEAQRHDVVLLGRPATPDPDFGIPARTIFEDILRNSPRPVVAVPGHIQTGEGILVAYDGSLQGPSPSSLGR